MKIREKGKKKEKEKNKVKRENVRNANQDRF